MGKTEHSKIEYTVVFGKTFNLYFAERFPDKTVKLIDDFVEHFEVNGFNGWMGKIAPSYRVPANYVDREKIILKATHHDLWHVHIGDPNWKKSQYGDYCVSEWVIHFKRINHYKIKLIELGWHNPMLLPSDDLLNEE